MQVIRAFLARVQLLGALSLIMIWLGTLRLFAQDPHNFP